VREALEQVCSAFLENGGRGAAPGHDDGADFLAPCVTRTAEDTGCVDVVKLQQSRFDFVWVDVFASCNNDIVSAPEDLQ